MKHKHHEIIVAWAADTSKVVQVRDPRVSDRWIDVTNPNWESAEYRIKPEPKPDTVRCEPVHLNKDGTVSIKDVGGTPVCRFVFDGETGKLKSAEVL